MIVIREIFSYSFCFFLIASKILFAQIDLPQKGICAHRGARNTLPENTIPAFKEALNLGAHMIEFDVWLSKDDSLIVIHDSSVDRTTNGIGLIRSLTYDEIKNLDAGTWKSRKFTGISVPTFEEVLEIMPKNIWLNIHIKKIPIAAKKVAELIVRYNRIHQSIMAISKDMIPIVKTVDKKIKICNMDRTDSPSKYVEETIAIGCDFIQLTQSADSLLPVLVQKLKENNVKINYYSTNSPVKLEQLFNSGVDFILVDDTRQMLNVAERIGIDPAEYTFDE